VQVNLAGDQGAGSAGDEHAFHFCQVAFEIIRRTVKNSSADYQREDGVAEEFESFVAFCPLIDRRGMDKGLSQQVAIGKPVADNLLDLVQSFLFHQKILLLSIIASRLRTPLVRATFVAGSKML
jgi:hypothetical protein